MTPAPAFNCAACGHRIGKRSGHKLTASRQILCSRCLDRDTHTRLHPDCPHRWHDMHDHDHGLGSVGTRAGVAAALGLWPAPKTPAPIGDSP